MDPELVRLQTIDQDKDTVIKEILYTLQNYFKSYEAVPDDNGSRQSKEAIIAEYRTKEILKKYADYLV